VSTDLLRRLLPRRTDLRAMGRTPGHDLLAGVTVSLVALPLALAFGITSGLGAEAGLVTAIVAGAVAAIFGGSRLQVSGPTGAMAVVLLPIVAAHGSAGVLLAGLMAGAMLVVMAACGLGRYARLVPLPVVEGFTLGIAVVITLQQLPAALGATASGDSVLAQTGNAVRVWIGDAEWLPLVTAAAVAVGVLAVGWWRPGLPGALIAVVVATAVADGAGLELARVGPLPRELPTPALPDIAWSATGDLLLPALAVALLAALESLLSATVADAMGEGEPHDPDRELFGQGLANLVSPLLGGMPATAAIARTAVNVRSGARSRLAALTHSVALLVMVLALAPLVSRVPVAALAGVLIATCARMVEVHALRRLWRAGRGEAAVLIATLVATVAFDLVVAVLLGVVAAGAIALRRMALALTVTEVPLTDDAQPTEDPHIVAYRIEGPLFFAGAHQALLELSALADVRVVILRLSGLHSVDATGATLLRDTIDRLERRGVTVMLSGVPDAQRPLLVTLGVYDGLAHEKHVFPTAAHALEHARLHVARVPHLEAP
jgi:MFS superfamily sulfate permease-like transporter